MPTRPTVIFAEIKDTAPAVVTILVSAYMNPLSAAAGWSIPGWTLASAVVAGSLVTLTATVPFAYGDAPQAVYSPPSVDPTRSIDGADLAAVTVAVRNDIGNPTPTAVTLVDSTSLALVSAGLYQASAGSAIALTGHRIPAGCSGWVQCDYLTASHRGATLGLRSVYANDGAALVDYRCLTSNNSPYALVYSASSSGTTSTGYNTTVGTDTMLRIGRNVATKRIYCGVYNGGAWSDKYTGFAYFDGDLYVLVGQNISGGQLLNPKVVSGLPA